ncbi:MAG: transposase [Sandaracinaceae bacterium]|nr:transposase [Sandaracinaceae bacterium]
MGAIYGEEEKAQAIGLVGESLRQHRQRHIRPLADKFEVWLAAVEPVLLPSEPLMAAVRYYRNHRDALFRFIDDPDVPADSCAPTERVFQNIAKLRLNIALRGQLGGCRTSLPVLLGIMAQCRAIRVLRAYLAGAFERLGTHRDVFGLDVADMTPAAFKRSAP